MWYIYKLNHIADGLAYWDKTDLPAYFFYEDANLHRNRRCGNKWENKDDYRVEWFQTDNNPALHLISFYGNSENEDRWKEYARY